MDVFCEASKEACDDLVRTFAKMNVFRFLSSVRFPPKVAATPFDPFLPLAASVTFT